MARLKPTKDIHKDGFFPVALDILFFIFMYAGISLLLALLVMLFLSPFLANFYERHVEKEQIVPIAPVEVAKVEDEIVGELV
jgi:hypothetical protein